jgi:hypothetical protein
VGEYLPKTLQEIMGHASIATLDLYGRLHPGDMDRYGDRLDTAVDEASTAKIGPTETGEKQRTRHPVCDFLNSWARSEGLEPQPPDP